MDVIIIAVYVAAIAAIIICLACIRKRMQESKACFFMDLFTTAASGFALAVSVNVAVIAWDIRQTLTVNFQALPLENAGKLQFTAPVNAEIACFNLGDGNPTQCVLQARR